ncbi:MAG: hypothetical protein ABRQ25_08770 [Clostridiaceae bacterium]
MDISLTNIIATVINIALLFGIIIFIIKAVLGLKRFDDRNKEMDKKLDIILDKLKSKEDN